MESTELFNVVVVPVIIGLVEVAKGTGMSARWAAPLALGLGVGLSVMGVEDGATMGGAVMRGLALGLSASGLYSAVGTQLTALHRQSVRARARAQRGAMTAAGRSFREDT